MTSMWVLTRRNCVRLSAGAVLAAPAILRRPAHAAEFTFKLATTILTDHPLNLHASRAAATIAERSGGRLMEETRQALQLSGLTFVETDRPALRAQLAKSGFYADTRARFGAEAWRLLDAVAGPLA